MDMQKSIEYANIFFTGHMIGFVLGYIVFMYFTRNIHKTKEEIDNIRLFRANYTAKSFAILKIFQILKELLNEYNLSKEYNILIDMNLIKYGYKSSCRIPFVIINNETVPKLFIFTKDNIPKTDILKKLDHNYIVFKNSKEFKKKVIEYLHDN